MSALLFTDLNFSVCNFCNVIRTCRFYRTFFTAFAHICVNHRNSLSDNSHIIQIRLYTVIRTSTYSNLKFMRQCNLSVSFIKTLINLLRKCIGIQKTILAGCSLAGYHRTHFSTGSSRHQAFFCNKLLKFINFIIWNSLYLHRKSCCIQEIPIPEFLCRICHTAMLCSCYLAIYSKHTCRKQICSSVIQKAHSLYSFFIFFADS